MWRLAGVLSVLLMVMPVAGQSGASKTAPTTDRAARTTKKKSTAKTPAAKEAARRRARHRPRASLAARRARAARIHQAFAASAELQPMAQQLSTLRSADAYAGVTAWARRHTGEAAAAAYLALGHAYLLDKRYMDAETALSKARVRNSSRCLPYSSAALRGCAASAQKATSFFARVNVCVMRETTAAEMK